MKREAGDLLGVEECTARYTGGKNYRSGVADAPEEACDSPCGIVLVLVRVTVEAALAVPEATGDLAGSVLAAGC